MRKFCVALFGLVLFSALVFNVSANTWPNWDEAVIYRDSIGETIEQEDITVCYVTHDENYIFFRVEFAGGTSGSRALLVYLDVDQDAGTGDSGLDEEYGYTLHDLGADWRLELNLGLIPQDMQPPISKWNPVTESWDHVAYYNNMEQGDTYINLEVKLSDLENPDFPIDLLFISDTEIADTDWNPDEGHLQYPVTPVGGLIVPSDKVELITRFFNPTLIAALALAMITIMLTIKRKR